MRYVWLIFVVVSLTGCASPPAHSLRIHEAVPGNLPEGRVRRVLLPHSGQVVSINPYPNISEKDVSAAKLQVTNAGNAILVQFDSHGTTELAEMTIRLRGQYIVVLVDEKPVAGILVERPIRDGQFVLLGDLTDAEAKALVESLNKLAGRPRDFGDVDHAP